MPMKGLSKQVMPVRTKDKQRTTTTPVRLLGAAAVEAALSKKARDIVVMDMQGVSGVADFFVLCTGDSELQVKAIVDAVRDQIRETYRERPWHKEGLDHYQWVILDYVDLVVHVFSEEKRAYYDLERLWGDAPREQLPDDGEAADVKLLQASPEQPPPTLEN